MRLDGQARSASLGRSSVSVVVDGASERLYTRVELEHPAVAPTTLFFLFSYVSVLWSVISCQLLAVHWVNY